jgi:hypothetical protein
LSGAVRPGFDRLRPHWIGQALQAIEHFQREADEFVMTGLEFFNRAAKAWAIGHGLRQCAGHGGVVVLENGDWAFAARIVGCGFAVDRTIHQDKPSSQIGRKQE